METTTGAPSAKFAVDSFAKSVFGLLFAATTASNAVPEGDDFSDVALTAPLVASQLAGMTARVARIMSETGRKRRGGAPVEMGRSAEDGFEQVVDAVDEWLEAVDRTVDRLTGAASQPGALAVTKDLLNNTTVIRAANVLRPQLKFYPPVDNSAAVPFVPRLDSKPNALVPLPQVFRAAPSRHESAISLAMGSHLAARGSGGAGHPYEAELQALVFGPEQMGVAKERIYGVLGETPWTWVDTPAALDILVGKLSQEREIAIDLEQHFFRSYQGFVCLMQVSTREEDFLVDALELRPHMQKLNVVLTNPKIVKVLHGADFDIQWLQRDFGLYVVNMFDTGQAARVLEYPKKSLAYLLEYFCSVKADKQYQLADWRIRPLPREMQEYAIADTHYLLYVYDRLRNELAAKSAPDNDYVVNVLNRSRQLCLQVYEKPPAVSPTAHLELYEKLRAAPLAGVHEDALAELFRWRDELARQEDESVAFVLPNRMLYAVAEQLPVTVEQLLAICVPVPPLTRAFAHEITAIVHRAKTGTLQAAGTRGFYSIAALLKPIAPAVLLPEAPPQEAQHAAPIVVSDVPKPQLHPRNANGSVAESRSRMFGATLEQDSARHSASVAAALAAVGKSLDPLFSSRVTEAFEQESRAEEAAAATRKRAAEEEDEREGNEAGKAELAFPASLADVHQLTQRNKRLRGKKDKPQQQAPPSQPARKPASPLDYAKMGASAENPVVLDDSPASFVRSLGPEFGRKTAPVPSGKNQLEPPAKEKKSKQREDHLQGFDVTSRVAPSKKAERRDKPGSQMFYVREKDNK